MKPIIIDAHCGAGKTTWAIEKMKTEADTSFVFCTPFLEEIERVRTACGKQRVAEPHNYNMSKTQDFNKLLAAGENIAVTHMTFLNATPETLELIKEGEYILILDEAMDAVVEFNKTRILNNSCLINRATVIFRKKLIDNSGRVENWFVSKQLCPARISG